MAQEIPQAVWEEISRQRRRTVPAADAGDAPVGTADCLVMPNLTRAEDQLEEAQRINAEHHRTTNH
ncbi:MULTISPECIES: hypothetical protein [unclassified Streptomyces]|uniref:hypothetical protein n=1 Tax=unclassified Streptomyces TaxID=2593676 RepID=UPI002552A80F|nr:MULTISPECIES: hypothetical protein [unclassified Streptomyces]WRZ62454.1 hypothetical protein OG408_00510 [Streptomyces sp. NBC_01257]WSU56424.1 hypothetical protein OG450_00550 [Streptomyces sp. NBC_01104]